MITPAIRNRRSTRQYKTDSIPDSIIEELITAGEFAPSAHGLKAVEYIIVRDQNLKIEINKILSVEIAQDFVEIAPVLIIPVVDTKKSFLPVQDLSVISQTIFLQATELGLGCVWKNVNVKLIPQLLALLKLPDTYMMVNVIPIGYPEAMLDPHKDEEFKKEKLKFY